MITETQQQTIVDMARFIQATYSQEDIDKAVRELYQPSWPTTYTNSETGRTYTPHHQDEHRAVYTDTPVHLIVKGGEGSGKSVIGIVKDLERLRRNMAGIMVCVAADTLVDGIPIAERSEPAPVNTLLGPAWASSSFCEGRADLFRVVTESGDQVVVTASHRFLTPTGFCPLRDLRVGSLIAVDGSEHGHAWREISPGSLADCWLDSRPSDESANPGGRYVRGGQLPPDGKRVNSLSLLGGCRAHACTDCSSCLSVLAVGAGVCRTAFAAGANELPRCGAFDRAFRWASRPGSLSGHLHDPTSHSVDSDVEMQSDHADWSPCSPVRVNILPVRRHLLSPALGRIEPKSCRDHACVGSCTCVVSSYPYYNTVYTKIASITFQEHGDFYGLTVPSIGHYSAHGLIHHNSPDLPHFKRSLWPEFRRWCPWEQVVPEHQYRSKFSWEPRAPFVLAFKNGATLMCGGIDDPGAWEGPNVSFAHFDEARRKKTATALKVLTGRVRIPGPKGEPPQIYFTTTPRKHWLHEYFGPLRLRCDSCQHRYEHYANTEPGVTYINLSPDMTPTCPRCGSKNYLPDDEHAAFKLNSMVLTLLTKENEGNLQEGFTENRALSLTSAEARVLLDAEWEDIEASERFLPSMLMWDVCREDLPSLTPREPLVVALDAATGRQDTVSDCFGIVGVTRHPDPARHGDTVAVRYVHKWQARPGQKISFQGTVSDPGPERVLRTLAKTYNLVMVPYDPSQLHDMATRLSRERVAWMFEFSQGSRRVQADTDLLNLIAHRRVAHDGNDDLREHIDNADRKLDAMGKKLRIVKREESLKVDLAVCLSQASHECLRLNLG